MTGAPLTRRRALGFAALFALACTGSAPPGAFLHDVAAEEAKGTKRLVLDVREPAAFAKAHVPGALNLQLGWSQLADRVRAYVPDLETALALHAATDKEAARALRLLERAGYTDVRILAEPKATASLSLLSAAELKSRLAAPEPPVVLDVRTPAEWKTGTIQGAARVEQDAAPALLAELDPDVEYAIICEGGYRSSQLASLLQREGFPRVHNVIDGMAGWRKLEK